MAQQIPFEPSTPSYRMGTTLDGVQYLLDVRWNDREGAWYFDLLDEEENPIASGVKIVLGALLTVRRAELADVGTFIASDLANTGIDATLDDIGVRVVVYFYTAVEMEAAE